jgi:hypothetical protein
MAVGQGDTASPTVSVPPGKLGSGRRMLGFQYMRLSAPLPLSFEEAAGSLCQKHGLTVCSESQWERTCAQDPSIGTVESWTATLDASGKLPVRGGAGGCAARQLVPASDRAQPRVAPCCTPSATFGAGTDSDVAQAGGLIMAWQVVLNLRSRGPSEVMFHKLVDFWDHKGVSAKEAVELVGKLQRDYPDFWTVHESCELQPLAADQSFSVLCQRLDHRHGKLGKRLTRYTWDGSTAGLRTIVDE